LAVNEKPALFGCLLWQIRIFEKGPCGAEGEEKARYPQGLRGTVDLTMIARLAGPSQVQSGAISENVAYGMGRR